MRTAHTLPYGGLSNRDPPRQRSLDRDPSPLPGQRHTPHPHPLWTDKHLWKYYRRSGRKIWDTISISFFLEHPRKSHLLKLYCRLFLRRKKFSDDIRLVRIVPRYIFCVQFNRHEKVHDLKLVSLIPILAIFHFKESYITVVDLSAISAMVCDAKYYCIYGSLSSSEYCWQT